MKGVGKTNLLLRFSEDKFSSNFITTLGFFFFKKKGGFINFFFAFRVEYKQRIVNISNQNVLIQVWDTAGIKI